MTTPSPQQVVQAQLDAFNAKDLDALLQTYAEEAMKEHLPNLQEELSSQQKENKNAPFVNISDVETKKLMMKAM